MGQIYIKKGSFDCLAEYSWYAGGSCAPLLLGSMGSDDMTVPPSIGQPLCLPNLEQTCMSTTSTEDKDIIVSEIKSR